jgi:beta-aspartyl-peptidase (threonine type)
VNAVIAIHGGAGTIARATMTPAAQAEYRDALAQVLQAGQALLAAGASALDAVTEAVRLLEECPLFNAGRGSVYTADERHELDACVMHGTDLACGAVAGVTTVRNPVLAARQLLERGGPVMLIGPAAEQYAAAHGCELVPPGWFGTPHRLQQLRAAQAASAVVLDHVAPLDEQNKFGTVGAVARDAQGRLAAATSTGGMTNKRPGRVGDSPIVGAGCYANDRTVAVSCTGVGESFIRAVAAHQVSALIEYAGLDVHGAARRVVWESLPPLGGHGGLIAVGASGEVALPFNTEGMYRGWARVGQAPRVAIYADEDIA